MTGTPVIVVTPEQLAELLRGTIETALAEQRPEAAPVLLDRAGVAQRLSIGTTTVDRLRREGMPCVFIGDSPRFDLAECVDWIRQTQVTRHAER